MHRYVPNESDQVENVGAMYFYIKVREHEEAAQLPPFAFIEV